MRSEGSETKRRLRASGVVRSLPSSRTSPFCVSMRHRGRSTCRRDPIRLSPSVALCYHPWWADPPSYWAVRARILLADPKGTAYGGSAFSSHLPITPLWRSSQNYPSRRFVNKGKMKAGDSPLRFTYASEGFLDRPIPVEPGAPCRLLDQSA